MASLYNWQSQRFELPTQGFDVVDNGYQAPAQDGSGVEVVVKEDSNRLQLLTPFSPWDGGNISNAKLLIKAEGKCTTDIFLWQDHG